MATTKERIYACIKRALPVGIKTSLWFLKIMLPVSFLVMLLSYFDILPYVSSLTAPLFTLIGLPGDAALVFVTSIFTNIYTAIALISGMDFTVREGVILAVMCLISHNFIVETVVLKKTGSSALRMIVLRVIGSFVAAIGLNLLLPDMVGSLRTVTAVTADFQTTLLEWLRGSLYLSVKIFAVIIFLMILQRLLEEFGILKVLSGLFAPLMKLFGLPASVSFLWIVGNTIGLAYGSAIMMDYVESGQLDKRDADLLNHHLAISHSQLEDPLLFAVIGLPMFWLIIPRLVIAVIVVWIRKIELKMTNREFVLRYKN
ncbi:nucleoside recognition protein [Odoribacter sp. OttesenSCG-928-A06]|nr:nucleoside recognition protein [Odoribacter sp. OttesenSCG-928-A06]